MSSPMHREPLDPVGACTVLDVAGDTDTVRAVLTAWIARKLVEDPTPGATSQAVARLVQSAMCEALRAEVESLKRSTLPPAF